MTYRPKEYNNNNNNNNNNAHTNYWFFLTLPFLILTILIPDSVITKLHIFLSLSYYYRNWLFMAVHLQTVFCHCGKVKISVDSVRNVVFLWLKKPRSLASRTRFPKLFKTHTAQVASGKQRGMLSLVWNMNLQVRLFRKIFSCSSVYFF